MGETNKTYLVKVCESQYKLSGSWYMNQARLLQFRLRRLNISVIFEVIKDDEEPTFLDAKDIGYELGMYEGLGTKEEQIERHRLNAIEVRKRWENENKDKIKERLGKHFLCGCGSEIAMGCKSKHNKTKKHLQYLDSIQ